MRVSGIARWSRGTEAPRHEGTKGNAHGEMMVLRFDWVSDRSRVFASRMRKRLWARDLDSHHSLPSSSFIAQPEFPCWRFANSRRRTHSARLAFLAAKPSGMQ